MASRISQLAALIATNTSKVDEYLESNDLPSPSFNANGPINLNIKSADVASARNEAINASMELLDLLQGPIACLLPKYNGTSLQAIYRHDVAAKVPLSGDISFQELAESCGIHVHNLTRIVRFAIVFHRLFQEPRKGFVAHSAGSYKLVHDPLVRAGVGQSFDDFYGSFARTVDAMDQFKGQEPNQTGFALAHNTDESMFQYVSSRPLKAQQFASAMQFYTNSIPANSASFLVNGYPWEGLGSGATVVDVGGSDGHVSISLARAHPDLHLLVQDRPDVVEAARTRLPADVKANQIIFQAYDFFTPQPMTADAYLFRWVFHDWPDKYVLNILRQLVPALRHGSRVIVNESICPEPGSLPLAMERTVRFMDMIMLTTSNSRLRDIDEWQQLFREADPRFGPIKCWTPEGAALAIIEVIWQA